MKLSIVICVYNTPIEYVCECIESIQSSTLQKIRGEYEICMVDDGSTVDYSSLLTKYPINYVRKENGGILSARARGIEEARGEYLIFCDSDDTVSFNYHLPMLTEAENKAADIVINGWATRTEKIRFAPKNDETMRSDIDVSAKEALLAFTKNEGRQHSFFVLWNKIYRRELLKSAFDSVLSSNIPPRMSYSEDALINFFAFKSAKRVTNVHTGYYFYRIHPSQSVNVTNRKKLSSQIDSMAAALSVMKENVGETAHREKILRGIENWKALMARAHYSAARSGGFYDLYPYISERYGIGKLKRSTAKDGAAYRKKLLLGENFTEIDRALFEIYNNTEPMRVKFSRKDAYTRRCVEFLRSDGKITDDPTAELKLIPKAKVSLKRRIVNNAFVYTLGLLFFKKGSKIREFLKKFT